MEKQRFVAMTEDTMQEIIRVAADTGAAAAMRQVEKEKKAKVEQLSHKKFMNTELLMENYRILKENANYSIYTTAQLDESISDILSSMMNLYDNELIIDSIKTSAARTATIIAHVDKMLSIFEKYSESTPDSRDIIIYRVFYDIYIEIPQISINQIGSKYHIARETVYKYKKLAIKTLSSLIFGVDSLIKW